MKISKVNLGGIAAVIVVIACAFLPWLTIESKHLVFTGMNTAGSSFGEPGKLNIFVAVIAGLLFLSANKWAARINLFITAFLVAWTFRNFILFGRCEMGECPDRGLGLYLSLLAAIITFICVLMSDGVNNRSKAS